jgi:hypothetical protein
MHSQYEPEVLGKVQYQTLYNPSKDRLFCVLMLHAVAVACADSPHGAEVALLQTGRVSGTQSWCMSHPAAHHLRAEPQSL